MKPTLYAEHAPDQHGMLAVGDGHQLYWEASGNPDGAPVVILHGGPGSGGLPVTRRYFDPARYRIIAFDQRNCGRSTPHAGAPHIDLSTNTTPHLIADLERLRAHLGVARWLVYGSSWGSTLALAYAQRHPASVRGILLVGVTTTRPSEIDWLYRGMAPLFPEEWARFRAGAPPGTPDDGLIVAYDRLLHDPDPAVRERAARDFHDWEAVSLSADPDAPRPARWADPAYRLARARIVTHYFRHHAWLDDGQLLKDAPQLADIPGILIQGRLDLAGPLVTAWELARAWPRARLIVVSGAGHSPSDAGMAEAIRAAADHFAAEPA